MAPEGLRGWTIGVSLASLFFILPHVVEDFAEGIAQRVGLSTSVGAALLGGFLALQCLGLVLVGQGRRAGFIATFWVGVIWVAGALAEHMRELVTGRFREGTTSVLWLAGLIVTQAASSLLAGWAAWRPTR